MGRAPAQATLRAPSATVAAVPARGSMEHQVGLESVVRASPFGDGGQARGGQAQHGGVARPGPSTVLRKSWWSYWR